MPTFEITKRLIVDFKCLNIFTNESEMGDGVGLAGAGISVFKKDAEILTGTTRFFKQSWKE
ncbi:Hypothetical protein FKW44_008029 [Caligus rogercresseyi]|uniref:Uncharacterized protein n=1 Tax=Caligus rogercresseyi TaxID=217165 RepID=A0A7T8KFJ4_CALRO|nr:Hypothetical protein FKW44_008029 [Caligus rogercresseyi]